MKKQIILLIAFFISFTSCKQVHCNREDSITQTEERVDTLSSNAEKCKSLEKKGVEMLLDSAIKDKNDTLYLNYKLINHTSKNFLLFHFKLLSIEDTIYHPETNYPYCSIYIIDSNNKLFKPYVKYLGKSDFTPDPDTKEYSYILLRAGESKYFHKGKYIGNFFLLGDSFKIRLRYAALYNDIFINKFKRMQRKNPQLKEYERFEGIIESNLCPLTLPQKKVSIDSILIYIKDWLKKERQ